MENNILDANIFGTERTAAEIMEVLRQKGYIDVYENNSGEIVVNAVKTLACTIAQDKTGKWQPIIEPRYLIPEIVIPCILLIILLNFINVKVGILLSLAITSGLSWLFTTNKRKRLKGRHSDRYSRLIVACTRRSSGFSMRIRVCKLVNFATR